MTRMKALLLGVGLVACTQVGVPAWASDYDAMISRHAAANGLPESLVRRVMMKESGGRAHLISAGNYGLMQIRHGTARGLGYSGSAQGLLDPETNMTYAAKYLAGAYRAAGGNQDRAVSLYQRGYYYEAKRQGLTQTVSAPVTSSFALASAPVADRAPVTAPIQSAPAEIVIPRSESRTSRSGKPLDLLSHVKQAFQPKLTRGQQRLARRDDAIQKAEMVRQQTQRDARPDMR
jgi:hypothetical protein